jgi:alpha-beta hydrolase superfamily lysophospholipase
MLRGLVDVSETTELLTMTDDFKLFARHWAPFEKADKTVVCIHGLGGCCGCFKPAGIGLASRGIDVWGFDLRGFGNSKEDDVPRGDTKNFKRHLDDIAEAINIIRSRSNYKKLFLLGHSLGALYVLWFDATYPPAVDGLVLLAPAVVNKPIMAPQMQAKFASGAAFSPETMLNTVKESFTVDSLEMAEYLPSTSSFSVRYFMGLRRFLMGDNMFVNASNDKKPTLIVQGDADEDALPVGAKQLFDNIASENKKLETIPGAKHTLYGTMLSPRRNCEASAKEQESILSLICSWIVEH